MKKEKTKGGGLGAGEWANVRRIVRGNSHLLVSGTGQSGMFLHIVERTLAFSKFEEWFRSKDFVEGFPFLLGLPTVGRGRSQVWRLLKDLEDRGAITKFSERSDMLYRYKIRINVPGILLFALQAFAKLKVDGESYRDRVSELASLGRKAEKIWRDNGWEIKEVKPLGTVEQEIAAGMDQNRDARNRRKEKRQKKELSPLWLHDEMKEMCEEYGQRYSDHWTKKDVGCARNWLGYCRQQGVDPRGKLRDICRLWPSFQTKLKNERGKPIELLESVSFSSYFKYRREIDSWIEVHKDERGWAEDAKIIEVDFRK